MKSATPYVRRYLPNLAFLGPSPRASMSQGVDHIVDSQPDRESRHALRIVGIVGKFPRVAEIRVVRNGDHNPPAVVIDTAPVRADTAAVAILRALREMLAAHDLGAIVDIVHRV